MPNNTESVVYEFIGDVSSLRKATNQANQFLDSYQKKFNQMSANGGFGNSSRAAKSFQSTVKSVSKVVSDFQRKMKDVSDVRMFPSSTSTKQFTAGLTNMQQVYTKLQSSNKLTTKEVQSLTAQLKVARQSLNDSGTGLDILISKERRFQQTLETVRGKADQFRNTMDTFRSRVSGAFDPLVTRINSLRNPFTRIVQTVQSFKDKSTATFGRVSQLASTVFAAFRRVSTAERDTAAAANTAAKSHSSLSTTVEELRSRFTRETKAIEKEKDSLDKKNKTLDSSTRNHRSLGSVIASLAGNFRQETNSIRNLNTTLGGLKSVTNLVRNALSGLISVPVSQWLAESAKQSISYTENLNLFSVALGSAVDQGTEFVNQMAELYGMDPSNLMRYAGNFYQLADAISMPDQASAALSLGLTKATNDISSLFNVPIETVFNDLSSGMQGMSRAVRKYGMDIRTVTLQQTALSLGLTEQVENMSEANRQGLRFITMMRQANNASGDFARTIESPANQLKIFKEQIAQLGRAIGDLFIGKLARAIQYINGFVMALRMVIQFIGTVLGLVNSTVATAKSASDSTDDFAGSIVNIGDAASDSAKKVKALLAPFDELTVLSVPEADTGGGGGGALGDLGVIDPAIESAISDMQWQLDNVKMKAVEVRDALLSFLGFKVEDGTILSWDADTLEQNLIGKFPQWTETIGNVFDNWATIIAGAKTFAGIVAAFAVGFTIISPIFAAIASAVAYISEIMPVIEAALAGVSGTALALAAVIALIVVAFVDLLITNEEFRAKATAAWESVVKVFSDLWTSILKPVLDRVGETLKGVYTKFLKPVVDQIFTILFSLWTDILQPLLSWLITALGPSISNLVDNIFDIVDWLFNNLGGFIMGLLQSLQGIIDFIAGVFTGDWERAWNGVVGIFAGIMHAIESLIAAILNAIISVANAVVSVVYNVIIGVINLIIQAINMLTGPFGMAIELVGTVGTPQFEYIQAPEIAMANGGVVTGPTQALIGEGRYDEAVMPLGNSPQMREFADSVANRVNSGEQTALLKEQNELLRQILAKTGVSIDGKAVTDVITKHQRNKSRALGG